MDEVLRIVVLGRAARNEAGIKNRQPIGTMYVKAPQTLDEFYTQIVLEELNVKEVRFTEDVSGYTTYQFKPQLRTVGPKYGKFLGQIKKALSEIDGNAAMEELNANGVLKLSGIGTDVGLEKEDLLIEMIQTEGYAAQSYGGVTVVLDTNLTEELLTEGFVREIISKVQTMRKEAGFEVMDKILLTYDAEPSVDEIFAKYGEAISNDVLAVEIRKGNLRGYKKAWNINGESVELGVEKVAVSGQ
jgi:isoleucyl-tRNA synthetase